MTDESSLAETRKSPLDRPGIQSKAGSFARNAEQDRESERQAEMLETASHFSGADTAFGAGSSGTRGESQEAGEGSSGRRSSRRGGEATPSTDIQDSEEAQQAQLLSALQAQDARQRQAQTEQQQGAAFDAQQANANAKREATKKMYNGVQNATAASSASGFTAVVSYLMLTAQVVNDIAGFKKEYIPKPSVIKKFEWAAITFGVVFSMITMIIPYILMVLAVAAAIATGVIGVSQLVTKVSGLF